MDIVGIVAVCGGRVVGVVDVVDGRNAIPIKSSRVGTRSLGETTNRILAASYAPTAISYAS